MLTVPVIETDAPGVYGPEYWPDGIIEIAVSGSEYTFVTDADVAAPTAALNTMPLRTLRYVAGPFVFPENFFGLHFARYPTGNPLTAISGALSYSLVRSHDKEDLSWASMEPTSGAITWTTFDAFIAEHSAAGRDIIFTVFGSPTWASARPAEAGAYGLGSAAEPASMTYLADFVTAVMERANGAITAIEVWNEPNNSTFYTGNKAQLALMTKTISDAARAVDAGVQVISSPVTNFSATAGGSAEVYLQQYLATSDGSGGVAADHVDIIGVHLYTPSGRTSTLVDIIANINTAVTTAGAAGNPIWDTESGIISPDAVEVSGTRYENLFARHALLAASLGIARACWYGFDYTNFGFSTRPDVQAAREAFTAAVAGKEIDFIVTRGNSVIARVGGELLTY
jgi:hypothetical protein